MTQDLRVFIAAIEKFRRGPVVAGFISRQPCERLLADAHPESSDLEMYPLPEARGAVFHARGSNKHRFAICGENTNRVVWSLGKLHDVFASSGSTSVDDFRANRRKLADLVERFPNDFFERIMFEGVLVILDKQTGGLSAYADKMGLEDFYYGVSGDALFFSNQISSVAHVVSTGFDELGQLSFLIAYNVVGPKTLFKNVSSLQPARRIDLTNGKGRLLPSPPRLYWRLPEPTGASGLTEAETVDYFFEHFNKAVARRADESNAVFLSGGLDSSSVTASIMNCLGKSVDCINYRMKDYSPHYVESDIIKQFQKHQGFNLIFNDVEELGDEDYEKWKEYTLFAPDYFNPSVLPLQNTVRDYVKTNGTERPFLTGETADTIIDFWCGVKQGDIISDNIANLNRIFYSPKMYWLARQPMPWVTTPFLSLSKSLYNIFMRPDRVSKKLFKYYVLIDHILRIAYACGRPKRFYSGRIISADALPGWSQRDLAQPEFIKTPKEEYFEYLAEQHTHPFVERMDRENMMREYVLILAHILSYTDTQMYRKTCHFYDAVIQHPFLDTEFVSMTTAMPGKHRAFKSLFRKVGAQKLNLPDIVTTTQKIDFVDKKSKPANQVMFEMRIGDRVRDALKSPAFLCRLDEAVVDTRKIEIEISDFRAGKSFPGSVFAYQALDWIAQHILR